MGFKKILVPHDGSKASDKALDKAIELAMLSQDSHIILFHVIPEIQVPLLFDRPIRSRKTGEVTSTSEYWRELYEDMKLGALKMLKERKRKCDAANISAESRSLVGYPSEEIIKYAAKNKIDIVVMGTSGLRGISKIKALGSVARRVSEYVESPILLVH